MTMMMMTATMLITNANASRESYAAYSQAVR
jgi:hypothetical protein